MNNTEILEQIPIEEIYEFLREKRKYLDELEVKKISKDFYFILCEDDYYDTPTVMFTSKKFFDEHGYIEDTYYDGEDGNLLLLLPDFLSEVSESTYESIYPEMETRKKLIELGFEERTMDY